MISKRRLATAAATAVAIGAVGVLPATPATAAGRPAGVVGAARSVPRTAATSPGGGAVRVDPVAVCDPVTGTALIPVTYTGTAPAEVLLTVRFASGAPGPRLGVHRFHGPGRHAFHVQWLPGGQYDVYVGAAPPAGRPVAAVATPRVTCTVHPTGTVEAVESADDVAPALGAADGGTLLHAGAVGLLAAAGAALFLGGAVLLSRRRRAPRR